MDLQSVFLSPFIRASTAYYKRKLQNKIKNPNDEMSLNVSGIGEKVVLQVTNVFPASLKI